MAWVRVAAFDEIPASGLLAVRAQGRRLVLVRKDDAVYALDEQCTHAKCSLADGALRGTSLVCLCHGARFDVRTGAALCEPAWAPLACFAVERRGGDLFVEIPDS